MTEYMRWLAAERGLDFDGYDDLWRWSVDELEAFWASIWDFFDVQSDGRATPSSPTARCPAPAGSPAPSLNYAEHVFRDRDDGEVADPRTPPSCASSPSSPGASCAPQVAARRRRPARARRRARRPRRRLPAQHPRGDRRLPRHRLPRRDLVQLLARLRRRRASSTASPRSSPRSSSPSTATATAAATSTASTSSPSLQEQMPSLERTVVLPYLDPDPDLGRRSRAAIAWDDLRAAARAPSSPSSASPSTIRSGSSTHPARPACRRRSSRARAASSSST